MVLDNVCETLENLPLHTSCRELRKNNLSKEENKALESLTNDESIIIKEADKGGAVVIMDKDYYETKIMEMLLNPEFNSEMSENKDKKQCKKLKDYCLSIRQFWQKRKQILWQTLTIRKSCFYGLPKFHKSKLIKDAVAKQNLEYVTCENPDDLTLRPIAGGPVAPTQCLSNLLDIILKPFCHNVESFVRDDLEFLRHIPDHVESNTTLVT